MTRLDLAGGLVHWPRWPARFSSLLVLLLGLGLAVEPARLSAKTQAYLARPDARDERFLEAPARYPRQVAAVRRLRREGEQVVQFGPAEGYLDQTMRVFRLALTPYNLVAGRVLRQRLGGVELIGATSSALASLNQVAVVQPAPVEVRPGGVLGLTLFWRAIEPPSDDLIVFVHVVGPDGKTVAQRDTPPRGARARRAAGDPVNWWWTRPTCRCRPISR